MKGEGGQTRGVWLPPQFATDGGSRSPNCGCLPFRLLPSEAQSQSVVLEKDSLLLLIHSILMFVIGHKDYCKPIDTA